MSNYNFNRRYSLIVGKPPTTTIISKVVTEEEVIGINLIPTTEDYRTVTINAVEITESDISARISSKATSNTQAVEISIYNLSDETLDIVERVNNYIILKAGYVGDKELGIIFTGQVKEFTTLKDGEDTVTKLICGEGYIPNNTVRVKKAFPEGTTADDLFKFFIKQYKDAGVPLGQYTANGGDNERVDYVQLRWPNETEFPMGYSVNGFLVNEINRLAKSVGYVSYIVNGRLFIHPKSYTQVVERYQVSSDDVYSVRKTSKTTSTSTSKTDNGVAVTLPLDSRINIDKQLEIIDGKFKGVYKVETCSHVVNLRHGNFETILSCKQIDA